jgi:hypothetical protein
VPSAAVQRLRLDGERGRKSNGHLYANDWPTNVPGNVDAYVRKMNMREWVRVGLGGISGRNGTLCSEYSYWHVFRSLKKNGNWTNDNTCGNEIPPGNVFWGTIPPVP